MTVGEEHLTEVLSKVLLEDNNNNNGGEEIDGLDEDLVAYIAGMLVSKVAEDEGEEDATPESAVDEVMVPFLESVACPDEMIAAAKTAVVALLTKSAQGGKGGNKNANQNNGAASNSTGDTTKKLRQGIVNMASDLTGGGNAADDEASRYLWGTDKLKPAANTLKDAHTDKTSAKDKRKRRQDMEAERRALAAAYQTEEANAPESLVNMSTAAFRKRDSKNNQRDVQCRNVTVSLDNGTVLLDGGEVKFAYQRRYGLIGENGVGKTTLLKAIAKEDGITGFPSHLRVLHVRQEIPALKAEMSVLEAVITADVERTMLLQQEKDLLAKLEGADAAANAANTANTTTADGEENTTTNNNINKLSVQDKRNKFLKGGANSSTSDGDDNDAAPSEFEDDLKELDEVYQRLQSLGSDSAEARAAMILSGLQFTPAMQVAPITSMSGGWQMRVALAAALFVEPDICLLDEPTNHLDLEAVLWLETYLQNYRHTLIVVSHDRGFLNEVCTDIIEFKKKQLTYYRGNYDTFVKLRDANIRNAMRLYQAYQEKREHMMEFIIKFRANAKRASIVQSRVKAVEKMDQEAPDPVVVDKVWRFSIPNSEPLGRPIISVDDVCFDYNPTEKKQDEYLLQKVNFGVDLDSKIAILGANGQGKTTLLNLIMGKLKPTRGGISINNGLRIGHFTQHSSDNFDLSISALENLLNMFKDDNVDDQVMRTFLGKFQIQGSDTLKPMRFLSGGQKSRVAFAALAYRKPHVLIIDEGSNHLSMEAVDALVEAVQAFKGGLMVVSHDQYFVQKTCSELWVIEEGGATRFRGDFEEYKKHTAEATMKRVEESVKRMHDRSS